MKTAIALIVAGLLAGVSTATASPFDKDDPVVVHVGNSDYTLISKFVEESPYITFTDSVEDDVRRTVNKSEYILDFAFYYARAICYGRVDGNNPISGEDIRSTPKPELLQVGSSAINGMFFEFACSD